MKINIDFIVIGLLVSNKKKNFTKAHSTGFVCYLHAGVILSGGCTSLTKPYGEGSFHIGCRCNGIFTSLSIGLFLLMW